jgi:hypothetical protein
MFEPMHEANPKGFEEAIAKLRCKHKDATSKFRCDICRYPQDEEAAEYSSVPQMFTLIEDSGDKNPGYIMFAAALNYANVDAVIEFFENELLIRLAGFNAYMIIDKEQTDVHIRWYEGDRKVSGWTLKEDAAIDEQEAFYLLNNDTQAQTETTVTPALWECPKCERTYRDNTKKQMKGKCLFCAVDLKILNAESIHTKEIGDPVFLQMARWLARLIS